jgi:hypothetical protein
MKQIQKHISVPLAELSELLKEAQPEEVLNVRMYKTYKDDYLVDVILLTVI